MKLLARLLLFVLPSALRGCGDIRTPDYSEYTHIPPEGIPQGWEFEFNPIGSDSASLVDGRHEVVVALRYTSRSRTRNLILKVEEMSLWHETPDTLTLTIPLFDSNGRPLGKGNYGVYEIADTIRKNMKVPPGYSIALSSPLSDSITAGISDIGVIIY